VIPDAVNELYGYGASIIPAKIDKTPLVRWSSYQQIRADWDQLLLWDEQFDPQAWGVVTGQVSGLWALDFDGAIGIKTMQRNGLRPHVRTGSGGFHEYVRHPGQPIRTVTGKAAEDFGRRFPGVDVRGEGGYAIFAGKNSQGAYSQLRALMPDAFDVVPDELRTAVLQSHPSTGQCDSVRPRGGGPTPSDRRLELVDPLLTGALRIAQADGRNNAGFWLAIQARDNGFAFDEAQLLLEGYVERVPTTNTKGVPESYTIAEANATLRQAYSVPPREPWSDGMGDDASALDGKILVTNRQLSDLTDECLAALVAANDPPVLFVRGGTPTRVRFGDHARPLTEPVDARMLDNRLTRVAEFVKRTDHGFVDDFPPPRIATNILAAESWPFPVLAGCVETPFMRTDGSVVDTSGFDAASGLLLVPRPAAVFPSVSSEPTSTDIAHARKLLLGELLADFPFIDEASQTNAVALLLTPLLRNLIDGPVPLALVSASQMGTGKGLFVDVVSLVAFGRNAPVGLAPTSSEEFRKRITAAFMGGDAMIVLDNLDDVLRSSVLAGALTAPVWTDRILGVSRTVTIAPRVTWCATGNNIELGGDLARRCYLIELASGTAYPWRRAPSSFRHPDLLKWVAEHRGELVWAGLTLARAWFAAGCPEWLGPTLGRFTEWCGLIGGILRHAELPAFLQNLERVYDNADTEAAEWTAFLEAWERDPDARAVATTTYILNATSKPHDPWPIPSDIAGRLDHAGDAGRTTVFGKALARVAGRRFNQQGLRVEWAGRDGHSKAALWRVLADDPV
jgi:hypothetical protein